MIIARVRELRQLQQAQAALPAAEAEAARAEAEVAALRERLAEQEGAAEERCAVM